MGIFKNKNRDEWGDFSDKARDKHRESGGIYARLLEQGFTDEDIQAEISQKAGHREVFLATVESEGGDPILGIGYTSDYRYEEEAAPGNLAKNLREHPHSEIMQKVDQAGTPVYVFNTADNSWGFGNSMVRNAEEAVRRHKNPYNLTPAEVWRKTVAELRAGLKGKVKPMPKLRVELERAYSEIVLGLDIKHTVSVGENHNGDALAIATDSPVLLAVLEILAESAQNDALAIGSSSNPFSRGYVIFDVREVASKTVAERRAHTKWAAARMKEAADVKAKLNEVGYLYFIGSPREDSERGIIYYINYSPRGGKQVFGWYNLAELASAAEGDLTIFSKE